MSQLSLLTWRPAACRLAKQVRTLATPSQQQQQQWLGHSQLERHLSQRKQMNGIGSKLMGC